MVYVSNILIKLYIRNRLISQQKEESMRNKNRDFFASYQRLAQIHSFINDIANQNPSFASIEVIGTSTQGRELRMIKLGVNHQANSKPVIWMDGGIHAREWISPATVSYFIQYLVDGWKANNADVVRLVTVFDWYILPVANPDGYEYTHTNVK